LKKTDGDSPFDLTLTVKGTGYSIMDMHFKLGLYEHQSASAIEGVLKLLAENDSIYLTNVDTLVSITITSYEPAFDIIGDPAKRDPQTTQSADHSMVYIVSTLIRKAYELGVKIQGQTKDALWKTLILTPSDYTKEALNNKLTRSIMEKVKFLYGGKTFDDLYPEGIPTQVDMTLTGGKNVTSGLIMFPCGHARNTECNLYDILDNKDKILSQIAFSEQASIDALLAKLNSIEKMSNKDLESIYESNINIHSLE